MANNLASHSGTVVMTQPAMQEMQQTWVQILSLEDPLEKEMKLTPLSLPGKSHGQRSQAS